MNSLGYLVCSCHYYSNRQIELNLKDKDKWFLWRLITAKFL